MQTAVGEVTWTLDRRRGPHRPSAKCDRSLPLSTARDTRGRPRNVFVSIPSCRSPSMVSDNWKSTCCAPMLRWQWSWMAPSTSRTPKRIGGTGGRIACFKSRATSSSVPGRRRRERTGFCARCSSEGLVSPTLIRRNGAAEPRETRSTLAEGPSRARGADRRHHLRPWRRADGRT